ncbi:MAG: c-type cytochrome [Proteobacteria bacterium]|nr:c-type cytochrome [Pseudomonadota bacterium]
MKGKSFLASRALAAIAALLFSASGVLAAGNPDQGRKAFLKCVACHSVEPSLHKTGPSLSNIWGKNAGAIESFDRYSEAIRSSGIVWSDKTLNFWLRDPGSMVPGTSMRIRGMDNAAERLDIVAYLKQLGSGSGVSSVKSTSRADPADRSNPPTKFQVTALSHCRDTYQITTATGEISKYWEFNLRFKSDTSTKGPPKERPVIVGSGMRVDRASLVFSSPAEISQFIKERC